MGEHKDWHETTMDFLEQDEVFIETMNAYIESHPNFENEFMYWATTYLSNKHPEDYGND